MELHEWLDRVDGPESFLDFVRALHKDFLEEAGKPTVPFGPGPNGWQNGTIGAFLEAAIAWADDSDFGANQPHTTNTNPWWRCANFLYCGKSYE